MKIKLFVLGIVAGIVSLSSCNDDMGLVGPSIQPDEDVSKIYVDSFMIQASTVLVDSIYARTSTALLGEFYDPLYGNLKSDYICQFYSEDGFEFAQTPIDGKIDSIEFIVWYPRGYQGGWIGDSLAPMTATVYPVIEELDRNYYTNADLPKYVDLKNPLAMKTYTARDLSVSDSLWNAINVTSSGSSYYAHDPRLRIKLPQELGQKFYDEFINNPETFRDQASFNRFFPGVYITTTFGSGCVLRPEVSDIRLYYKYHIANHLGEMDSVMYGGELFPVTKEVIQMNRVSNTDIDALLEPNDEYTYLKTPAGVFTRLTIPAKEIISKIEGRKVNNFYFSLQPMPQENWKYALSPPRYLLLLPEDSLQTFFENSSVSNNVTSFYASYSGGTPLSYSFGNISNLLKHQAENAPEEDLRMLVVPVSIEFATDYYGNTTTTPSSMWHYLVPSGVKLRKDPEKMKVQVVTSEIPRGNN